ncbi:hypothetical protein [Caballeronia zhejiangensis]|uniref:Uncharacterized protein n=1 Tax=Caballeronia zhejiangensis TaxID=871203 RepID=A0A656QCX9_9BURK|nr:hypothetical protein [Caballeronia zhejiangensis]AET95631.1 hypothetical protein BYI23_F000800 [Burkholderia sp. YI23]KDR27187.1 hypothetical protein BG60_18495 [Caballeronia zhejiangensis]
MTRPFLVCLADVIALFVVTYLLLSFATTVLIRLASWPEPNRWIAIFVVGAVAIICAPDLAAA